MKSLKSIFLLILNILFFNPVFAQTDWIADNEMYFEIQVNTDFRTLNPNSGFYSNTAKINLSFSCSRNTYATPFIIKWYSGINNQKVEEYVLNIPSQNNGHGYGLISNNRNTWPRGNCYVEIWLDRTKLGTRESQIQ